MVAAGLAGMYGMRSNGAEAPAEQVVISQFYGAGGSEGVFSSDYVELYNPGDKAVSLEGYILGYSSGSEEGKAGSTVDSDGMRTEKTIGLAGTIPAKGYYLVCGADNTCREEAYQIQSFNRKWQDLVIDDQATVTIKLYEGGSLADVLSTEGSSCQYMVSSSTSVISLEADRGSGRGGNGLRTFYWGDASRRNMKTAMSPQLLRCCGRGGSVKRGCIRRGSKRGKLDPFCSIVIAHTA